MTTLDSSKSLHLDQGTTSIVLIAAVFSMFVVMLLTPPRSVREWAAGLICTIFSSICGGAAAVQYFSIQSWADSPIGLIALGGVIFACGLPGWAIVRWVFNYIRLNEGASIANIIKEAKETLKS